MRTGRDNVGTPVRVAAMAWLLLGCGAFSATGQSVAPRSIWDGVFSEAQAERGKAAYQARCAMCHDQDLVGDIEAPPLTGPRFKADWVGRTLADRFERNRTTMPDIGPAILDDQTNVDILAYILKFNGYPSGTRDLAADANLLKKIVIERRPD